jgi:hypothetical protein
MLPCCVWIEVCLVRQTHRGFGRLNGQDVAVLHIEYLAGFRRWLDVGLDGTASKKA